MSRRLNWIAAVLMIVLLLLGGYVGAYFGLSEQGGVTLERPSGFETQPVRCFGNLATARIFAPMVKIESMTRGEKIIVEVPIVDPDSN